MCFGKENITFRIIMLFLKSSHMPCWKLIPPFTFTHKKHLCPLCTCACVFSFLCISKPFSSYERREMTSFTVVWTTQALDQNIFNFSFLTSNRSWQFIPAGKLVNILQAERLGEIITENRSYIAVLDVGNNRKRKNQNLRCFMKSYFIKLITSACDK